MEKEYITNSENDSENEKKENIKKYASKRKERSSKVQVNVYPNKQPLLKTILKKQIKELKEVNNKQDEKYYTTLKNLCMICKTDMGPQNPRQLCGKTYCLFEDEYE